MGGCFALILYTLMIVAGGYWIWAIWPLLAAPF